MYEEENIYGPSTSYGSSDFSFDGIQDVPEFNPQSEPIFTSNTSGGIDKLMLKNEAEMFKLQQAASTSPVYNIDGQMVRAAPPDPNDPLSQEWIMDDAVIQQYGGPIRRPQPIQQAMMEQRMISRPKAFKIAGYIPVTSDSDIYTFRNEIYNEIAKDSKSGIIDNATFSQSPIWADMIKQGVSPEVISATKQTMLKALKPIVDLKNKMVGVQNEIKSISESPLGGFFLGGVMEKIQKNPKGATSLMLEVRKKTDLAQDPDVVKAMEEIGQAAQNGDMEAVKKFDAIRSGSSGTMLRVLASWQKEKVKIDSDREAYLKTIEDAYKNMQSEEAKKRVQDLTNAINNGYFDKKSGKKELADIIADDFSGPKINSKGMNAIGAMYLESKENKFIEKINEAKATGADEKDMFIVFGKNHEPKILINNPDLGKDEYDKFVRDARLEFFKNSNPVKKGEKGEWIELPSNFFKDDAGNSVFPHMPGSDDKYGNAVTWRSDEKIYVAKSFLDKLGIKPMEDYYEKESGTFRPYKITDHEKEWFGQVAQDWTPPMINVSKFLDQSLTPGSRFKEMIERENSGEDKVNGAGMTMKDLAKRVERVMWRYDKPEQAKTASQKWVHDVLRKSIQRPWVKLGINLVSAVPAFLKESYNLTRVVGDEILAMIAESNGDNALAAEYKNEKLKYIRDTLKNDWSSLPTLNNLFSSTSNLVESGASLPIVGSFERIDPNDPNYSKAMKLTSAGVGAVSELTEFIAELALMKSAGSAATLSRFGQTAEATSRIMRNLPEFVTKLEAFRKAMSVGTSAIEAEKAYKRTAIVSRVINDSIMFAMHHMSTGAMPDMSKSESFGGDLLAGGKAILGKAEEGAIFGGVASIGRGIALPLPKFMGGGRTQISTMQPKEGGGFKMFTREGGRRYVPSISRAAPAATVAGFQTGIFGLDHYKTLFTDPEKFGKLMDGDPEIMNEFVGSAFFMMLGDHVYRHGKLSKNTESLNAPKDPTMEVLNRRPDMAYASERELNESTAQADEILSSPESTPEQKAEAKQQKIDNSIVKPAVVIKQKAEKAVKSKKKQVESEELLKEMQAEGKPVDDIKKQAEEAKEQAEKDEKESKEQADFYERLQEERTQVLGDAVSTGKTLKQALDALRQKRDAEPDPLRKKAYDEMISEISDRHNTGLEDGPIGMISMITSEDGAAEFYKSLYDKSHPKVEATKKSETLEIPPATKPAEEKLPFVKQAPEQSELSLIPEVKQVEKDVLAITGSADWIPQANAIIKQVLDITGHKLSRVLTSRKEGPLGLADMKKNRVIVFAPSIQKALDAAKGNREKQEILSWFFGHEIGHLMFQKGAEDSMYVSKMVRDIYRTITPENRAAIIRSILPKGMDVDYHSGNAKEGYQIEKIEKPTDEQLADARATEFASNILSAVAEGRLDISKIPFKDARQKTAFAKLVAYFQDLLRKMLGQNINGKEFNYTPKEREAMQDLLLHIDGMFSEGRKSLESGGHLPPSPAGAPYGEAPRATAEEGKTKMLPEHALAQSQADMKAVVDSVINSSKFVHEVAIKNRPGTPTGIKLSQGEVDSIQQSIISANAALMMKKAAEKEEAMKGHRGQSKVSMFRNVTLQTKSGKLKTMRLPEDSKLLEGKARGREGLTEYVDLIQKYKEIAEKRGIQDVDTFVKKAMENHNEAERIIGRMLLEQRSDAAFKAAPLGVQEVFKMADEQRNIEKTEDFKAIGEPTVDVHGNWMYDINRLTRDALAAGIDPNEINFRNRVNQHVANLPKADKSILTVVSTMMRGYAARYIKENRYFALNEDKLFSGKMILDTMASWHNIRRDITDERLQQMSDRYDEILKELGKNKDFKNLKKNGDAIAKDILDTKAQLLLRGFSDVDLVNIERRSKEKPEKEPEDIENEPGNKELVDTYLERQEALDAYQKRQAGLLERANRKMQSEFKEEFHKMMGWARVYVKARKNKFLGHTQFGNATYLYPGPNIIMRDVDGNVTSDATEAVSYEAVVYQKGQSSRADPDTIIGKGGSKTKVSAVQKGEVEELGRPLTSFIGKDKSTVLDQAQRYVDRHNADIIKMIRGYSEGGETLKSAISDLPPHMIEQLEWTNVRNALRSSKRLRDLVDISERENRPEDFEPFMIEAAIDDKLSRGENLTDVEKEYNEAARRSEEIVRDNITADHYESWKELRSRIAEADIEMRPNLFEGSDVRPHVQNITNLLRPAVNAITSEFGIGNLAALKIIQNHVDRAWSDIDTKLTEMSTKALTETVEPADLAKFEKIDPKRVEGIRMRIENNRREDLMNKVNEDIKENIEDQNLGGCTVQVMTAPVIRHQEMKQQELF